MLELNIVPCANIDFTFLRYLRSVGMTSLHVVRTVEREWSDEMDNDLISRQAALNAIGDEPLAWTEGEYELGLQYQWQSDVDALNACFTQRLCICIEQRAVGRQAKFTDAIDLRHTRANR